MGTFGSQVSSMNEHVTRLAVICLDKAYVLHGRDRHRYAENCQDV